MFKRLQDLKTKILSRHTPEPRIVFVEEFRNETRAEAQARHDRENNLKPISSENYIFINTPSDKQITERSKKEFSNNSS